MYWCKKCEETTEHEHKRSKLRGTVGLPSTFVNEDGGIKDLIADDAGNANDGMT